MITKRVYLGLDNGYSYVKTSEGVKIPSAMFTTNNVVAGGTGNVVSVGEKTYVIDKHGQYITDISKTLNESDKEITQVTTLAATYLSFKDAFDNYKDVDCLEVVIGVGLPISYFTKQKDSFVEMIKDCSGSSVKVDDGSAVTIKFVEIYPYPQSAAIAFLNKEAFKEAKNSIVLDLGWGTLDVTVFADVKPVTGKYRTYPLGVKKLFGTLASELTTELNIEKSRFDIEDILKEKAVFIDGEPHSIAFLDKAIEDSLTEIRNAVNSDFNNELSASRKVFLVGGGFEAFGDRFKQNHVKQSEKLSNAQFANANAFMQ